MLAIVVLAVAAALVPAAAQAASPPSLIAKNGFGDSQNSYSWSIGWFKGKLYIGTARSELCVENAITQFYFPFGKAYLSNPFKDVHCAPDPTDLDLRAEIWQYTPETGKWKRVFRSPADIPNPTAKGKFVARDVGFRGTAVMKDAKGRAALFISGVTADEYLPQIAKKHPPRILRTYDGEHFTAISNQTIVRQTGAYSSKRAIGYRGMRIWKGDLYVVASSAFTGDGAVFKVTNPFGTARLKQVTPPGMHVFELEVFAGDLYVGTGSYDQGYAVYKTEQTKAPWKFEPVVLDGAGNAEKMVSVLSMHPFKGYLYVGGVSWYSFDKGLPSTEMIRIDPKGNWEVVTGAARQAPDGSTRMPISGLPAGFGNAFNAHIWRINDINGTLFAGTLDWSWYVQNPGSYNGRWAGLYDKYMSQEFGFDLWASCDGTNWFPVTRNAFGFNSKYDFGVRALLPTPAGLFIGSANHGFGTDVWQGDPRYCTPTAKSKRSDAKAQASAAPAAPQGLLTDVQTEGTVLSWEPVAGATAYRVERSAFVDAPVSVLGGPEHQVPIRETAEMIGTTPNAYFIDRTRRLGTRYEYQVFAVRPGSSVATPSNVQMVPDERTPATYQQLDRALAGSSSPSLATIATAGGVRRGGGTAATARVARLARSAGDDQVRRLAYRLERRLKYAGLAGGPSAGP